jgi:hypothetical protein
MSDGGFIGAGVHVDDIAAFKIVGIQDRLQGALGVENCKSAVGIVPGRVQ